MMLRKCIGCGELKSKEVLIKITKNYKDGSVVINPNSKIFGRSAYLCYNQNCIDMAFKKSKLNKVLKTSAFIDKNRFQQYITNS